MSEKAILNNDPSVTAMVSELIGENPDQSLILQYLIQIQQAFNFVPDTAAELVAATLGVSKTWVHGLVSFYSFLSDQPRGAFDIRFSDSITDHMLGSCELMARLCSQLDVDPGVLREDGRVTVDVTSCTGMCDQGPAILVNRRAIANLNNERIEQIATLVENETPLDLWPKAWFVVEDGIHKKDILLESNFDHGTALKRAIDLGAEAFLAELKLSGLRGRGGAGFSTATKWSFCRQAEGEARYVVCNADEGEPGTFKDRVLLTSYAHEMIEGMSICALVIGAEKGFIYLRGEYLHLLDPLETALAERRQLGWLGQSIAGVDGFDFDIEIHLGAGAYICGEESALIESLEGKRGIPRNRPPFPVECGYLNQPTVVNNVESFFAVAHIAVHGGQWFADSGTQSSSGTKLLSISGDCERPGIYEFPFGVTVEDVLDACGGENAQAVQIAGPAGETVPAEEFHRKIAFEDLSTGGAFMVFGPERNMLHMVQNFAHFFVHESCGFCTPCRVGGALLSDLVDKVTSGRASKVDLDQMQEIASLMKSASHCGLGATASNPVADLLTKFSHIYEPMLVDKPFEPAFDLEEALSEAREMRTQERN